MPRLAEYRWFRGFSTASASFFTATSGDGMSGFPKPRSTTSTPERRASIFSASMMPKTYGGRALIRRNSMTEHGTSRPCAISDRFANAKEERSPYRRRSPRGGASTDKGGRRSAAPTDVAVREAGRAPTREEGGAQPLPTSQSARRGEHRQGRKEERSPYRRRSPRGGASTDKGYVAQHDGAHPGGAARPGRRLLPSRPRPHAGRARRVSGSTRNPMTSIARTTSASPGSTRTSRRSRTTRPTGFVSGMRTTARTRRSSA